MLIDNGTLRQRSLKCALSTTAGCVPMPMDPGSIVQASLTHVASKGKIYSRYHLKVCNVFHCWFDLSVLCRRLCPFVRLSFCPCFPDFCKHALRYQFESWYIYSVGGPTCRVRKTAANCPSKKSWQRDEILVTKLNRCMGPISATKYKIC